MAYTRAWDELTPSGGEDPGTVDDIIRALKQDIRERMEHVVEDWDDDPVVPIEPEAASFAFTDKTLIIPIFAGFSDADDDVTAVNNAADVSISNENGLLSAGTLYVPIILPVGVTIKNAGIFGWRTGGSDIVSMSVYAVDLTDPEVRTLLGVAAAISGTGGWEWANIGAIVELTTAARMYVAVVTLAGSGSTDARASAIRVIYDSEDATIRI